MLTKAFFCSILNSMSYNMSEIVFSFFSLLFFIFETTLARLTFVCVM